MTGNELFEQAQRLFIEGKHAESIEKFTEALKAGFEPGITYLSRGAGYLKMNEPDKAIEDFTRGIEADPEKANAYYYRGAAHMAKDEYEKAVADMNCAIELKPDHRAAIFARGMAKVSLGRKEEGATDIKTAMTHAEAEVQGFADTYGWRTQVEKVIAALEGERRPETMILSDEEMRTLKKLLLPEEDRT
jgi:tetratricopeptide (TPR) repeat protein